jgi:L-asparaginase / beta-aspartyl-peptidase
MKLLNFLLLFFFTISTYSQQKYAIVIHGGSGNITKENMSAAAEKIYEQELINALQIGYDILKSNGTSLDAVEAAVVYMENSPFFNAGKGSVKNSEGIVEMDASIMDGKSGRAGAVAAVKTIKNPIKAARLVMDSTKHVLLIGKGADDFAKTSALEIVPVEYFLQRKTRSSIKDTTGMMEPDDNKYGTVGAVALDKHGNLAAATSTGGTSRKLPGRVGDSPIIGAGTYANNKTCAVSASGTGEYFIRNVITYDIAAMMEYRGFTLDQATDEVINIKLTQSGGDGGVISIDSQGNISVKFNTPGMFRAYITVEGEKKVEFYR